MRPRALVTALAVVVAAGCGHARPRFAPPAPPPVSAAPVPAPDTSLARPTAPRAPVPVGAPWDTAATANGRAGQRNHIYPSGLSEVGRRLVDSLPDPSGDADAVPAPTSAAPAPPAPPVAAAPSPGIGESGCWEVQLLVSADKGRAEELRQRIEKGEHLAAWVRTSGALYRVRAGGCLSPDGAAELANRLKARGYPEAFRVMRETP